jgi:hypothetical protein
MFDTRGLQSNMFAIRAQILLRAACRGGSADVAALACAPEVRRCLT